MPQPGLVIRYAYPWQREALQGREEGAKDRPCAIILAVLDDAGQHRVLALPITHSPPADPADAIELPPATKQRLGLDDARSWVVVTEANAFTWPGPDIRSLPGKDPGSVAYGFLPPAFFRAVRDRFLEARRRQIAALVQRTE